MTDRYVGSSYVPVRPQFLNRDYEVKEEVREVLITTGGGDSENIAGQILDVIQTAAWKFHVVVGRFSPHFSAWKEREEREENLTVHHDVKDMAGLMCRCDLAVTAGGTTVYELAAVGVPFVCFSYAQNQEALAKYVGCRQIAGYGGAYHLDREGTLHKIKELVSWIGIDREERVRMHAMERSVIDGKGADRLAKLLMEHGQPRILFRSQS
jgi:spore coat polysaccharide biosynthesis predicted glycosyltransferase SpsG